MERGLIYGSVWMWVAASPILLLFMLRKYQENKWGFCKNQVGLEKKIAIVTGANSGLGYETAKELYKRGATVVLACRSEKKGLDAINKIKKSLKNNARNGKLIFFELNLASLESTKKFCSKICMNFHQLNILINNAGVSHPLNTKLQTEDGFEIHFGVNYIGHFVLTLLLLPLLKNAKGARIINVSSLLHERATLHLEDLNFENRVLKNPYSESKLLQILFGQELSSRLVEKHLDIQVYNVCPGWVNTNLFRHSTKNWLKVACAFPVALVFMRSSRQGAQTSLYCATDTSLASESGFIYRDCHRYSSKYVFNSSDRNNLWDQTCHLLNNKGLQLKI